MCLLLRRLLTPRAVEQKMSAARAGNSGSMRTRGVPTRVSRGHRACSAVAGEGSVHRVN